MENVTKADVTAWIQEFREKHENKWNEMHADWRRENQDYINKTISADSNGLSGIPNREYMKTPDMLKDFLVKKGFKVINYRTISCSD